MGETAVGAHAACDDDDDDDEMRRQRDLCSVVYFCFLFTGYEGGVLTGKRNTLKERKEKGENREVKMTPTGLS